VNKLRAANALCRLRPFTSGFGRWAVRCPNRGRVGDHGPLHPLTPQLPESLPQADRGPRFSEFSLLRREPRRPYCLSVHLSTTSSRSNLILRPFLTVTPRMAVDRQVRSRILGWISVARVSLNRSNKMAKKPNRKAASPELAQAEERIETIKVEIAQAMIQRNTLPKSASDEEKDAVAACVEQLQARYHEAVQHLLAIKHEETTAVEREHKEKKLRHQRLRASRQPGGHAAPHEEPAAPPHRMSVRPPMDRAAEEAQMDAANEEDLFFERQQLEEEDRESADELAHQRRVAEKKQKRKEAAERREAKKREKKEAKAKAEAAQLEEEREAHGKIRQQAALQRAEETKAKKRQQRAEREARRRAAQDARSSGWLGEVLRKVQAFFGGRR